MVHLLPKPANLNTSLNTSARFGLAVSENLPQAIAVNPSVAVSTARNSGVKAATSSKRFNPNGEPRQTEVERGLPQFTRWMDDYRKAAPAINTTMAVIGTTGNGLVRLDAATGAFTRSLGARSFYGVVNNTMDGYIAESPTLTRFLKEHPVLSGIPLVIGMSALCSFAGDGLRTILTSVYDYALRPPVAYLVNRFGLDMKSYKGLCCLSDGLKNAVALLENTRFRNTVGLGALAVVGMMAASRYNRNHLPPEQ